MRVHTITVAILIPCLLILGGCHQDQEIQGTILEPKTNASVGRTIRCSGEVSGKLEGYYLWLAVEEKDDTGQSLYWPKQSALNVSTPGYWTATILEDGPGNTFSLALFALRKEGVQAIEEWFNKSIQTGEFPPIRSIPTGIVLDRVEDLRIE